MPGCKLLSWLAAPIRWIMSYLSLKGSYITRNQSGDLSQSKSQDVLGLVANPRDYWWVEGKLWHQFSGMFGFENCAHVHTNNRQPYYTTLCDKGTRSWPNSIPTAMKSLYKVRLLYLNVTNPHGVLENKYDIEGNIIKRPLLHVTNSPKRVAKKYHFTIESRLNEPDRRIAVPWQPKTVPSSTPQPRESSQERYLVVAYSKNVGIILEVSHNGSQIVHVVNLLAELYQGNIPIRNYMHSYISPDEKLLVIGDCLANGELSWTVLKISGDTLSPVKKLNDYFNIRFWCVYSALSFEPTIFQNRFIVGGKCAQVNAVGLSNELCSFIIDENHQLQPCCNTVINFSLSHIVHSPNGSLCIVLNADQRYIHIYKSQTLDELKVITETSIPHPLPTKEIFLFPKLHFSANRDGQPLMFKMFKWISGCNVVRISRGGVFISVCTCDRNTPNKIIRYIVLRLPLTEVLSLKEFCKRQILQLVSHVDGHQLPLPNQMKNYVFLL